jgi:murein DD-endopeptidase MepM/ murein hydrolase activator NlpD
MFRMMGVTMLVGLGLSLPVQEIAVSARARALQPGEIVLLTFTPPAGSADVRVRAFDRPLVPWRAEDGSWRVLVGIDLDVAPGAHAVSIEAGGARGRHELVVTGKEYPTRRLTVDPSFVDPPAGVQDRIVREARELNAVWALATPAPYWTGPFVRPVPHEANSAFGTRSVFNGQPRSPHGGADFRSPAGTPVRAPNAGRVVVADDLYYTGGTVAIDHGVGLVSLVAHLSAVDVEEGDMVEAGDVVGKVGATGRVTGAHLHWTLRAGGARVDPLSLLDLLGER